MDGNLTGWTIVHRESEWDEYGRTEAIAGVLDERRRCGKCQQIDSYIPEGPPMPVTWPDGRVFVVQQHRCLGCGALEMVERDFREAEKDHKDEKGKASPSDGRRMTVDERR